VKYIEECRAMGIRVQPPDVNTSQVRFSVAGDTVRFGLAAIKNVGEAAMESILKTRAEDGAFAALEDFCVRVDLRLVNRRVIESLIKAGAFDSLGLTRAHLLTQCDLALESGQRQQRERAEGQASFFDLLPAAAPAPRKTRRPPSCPSGRTISAWGTRRKSSASTSRATRWPASRAWPRRSASPRPAELASASHGARVTLFGHVAAIKETATKSGNRMAFLTLEDMAGTVEVTVFPEPYKAAARLPAHREPIIVRGRMDDSDKGRVVLAEDVRLLEQSLAAGGGPRARNGGEPSACRVRVERAGAEQTLDALQAALRGAPGRRAGVRARAAARPPRSCVRARGCGGGRHSELVTKLESAC
jgi:DNA polymerase-3 subunit alpha